MVGEFISLKPAKKTDVGWRKCTKWYACLFGIYITMYRWHRVTYEQHCFRSISEFASSGIQGVIFCCVIRNEKVMENTLTIVPMEWHNPIQVFYWKAGSEDVSWVVIQYFGSKWNHVGRLFNYYANTNTYNMRNRRKISNRYRHILISVCWRSTRKKWKLFGM